MTQFYKYKKTMHLPFSKGLQNDDRRMEDESCFDGKTVAVTVKMDGENTSLYRDGLHARSLDSAHHPSRSVVKQIHASIKHLIPKEWRICGENMYAKHSIHYTDLESFFYVFSVWDEDNICLPLNQTLEFCEELGLTHVKILDRVRIEGDNLLELEKWYDWAVANGQEGIVVRNIGQYHYDNFQQNLAKAVRANHIQTDVHWTKSWVPNLLKTNDLSKRIST